MNDPRLLIIGAHPDDAEFHAGGLATIYRQHDCAVKFLSVTDGSAGHHQRPPEQLKSMRCDEAAAAAAIIGAESEVWDFPDGRLQPTLEVRDALIAEIRRWRPDLVLTHRPNDYHPDHRAVGTAVQDASYLLTVPLIVRDVPALRSDPIVAYMRDDFTRPYAMQPDVVLDVEAHEETVAHMIGCHASQVFEWLPFNLRLRDAPIADADRAAWARKMYRAYVGRNIDRWRPTLVEAFGADRGNAIHLFEVYEISEYAGQLQPESRRRLFFTAAE